MDILNEEFQALKSRHPYWSSHTVLANLVMRKRFGVETIKKGFTKLVDKDDYDSNNKKEVLNYLLSISKLQNEKLVPKNANKNVVKKGPLAPGEEIE